MKISPFDAVEHIYNSLDSGHETDWYDADNDALWSIRPDGDALVIEISRDDEVFSSHKFRLIPE